MWQTIHRSFEMEGKTIKIPNVIVFDTLCAGRVVWFSYDTRPLQALWSSFPHRPRPNSMEMVR